MRDTKLRVGGQLAINLVSFFCFYFSSIIQYGIDWKKLIVYTVVTTFLVWELLRIAIIMARKRFPGIGVYVATAFCSYPNYFAGCCVDPTL